MGEPSTGVGDGPADPAGPHDPTGPDPAVGSAGPPEPPGPDSGDGSDDPEARSELIRRYHMRCRVDDLRAGLPRRRRRIAFATTVTVLLVGAAALTGASAFSVLGVGALLGIPVAVAWGSLRRDRGRLARWEASLAGDADPPGSGDGRRGGKGPPRGLDEG